MLVRQSDSGLDRLLRSSGKDKLTPDSIATARCLARLLGDPSDFTLHPTHFALYWPDGRTACVNYRRGWVTN